MQNIPAPRHRVDEAHRIAEDTFLVPGLLSDDSSSQVLQLNSLVIRGREPVVVDTGAPINRTDHLNRLFEIVDPEDVRWVFLTHDDADHAGNLGAILDACPAAIVATSWLTMLRLVVGGQAIPPERWHQVGDGDFVDIGDRVMVVQRPPLYDSPATYGLFDTQTDLFWAADCFGSVGCGSALEATDVADDEWRQGFIDFHHSHSPWLEGIDGRWWNRMIDRFAERRPEVIASAHGPVLRGARIVPAIDLVRELPQLPSRHDNQPSLDRLLLLASTSTF